MTSGLPLTALSGSSFLHTDAEFVINYIILKGWCE